MYLIAKDELLNTDRLGKILRQFQTKELPGLNKAWKYYKGKQQIMYKKATDVGKPCNKICINYCYSIVQNYLGYMTGIPIRYDNDNEDITAILDVLNYNDVSNQDTEFLRQALIFGRAFCINYIDEEGKQRFRNFDARECVPVYFNNLNNDLAYVVRFYREDLLNQPTENYIVEVYAADATYIYKSNIGFQSFELIDEQPNFFNQVPVTVFSLNEDEENIFAQIISLQDSYNDLYSGAVDNFDQFADAYLLLKGVVADADDLASMKQNRVLMVDPDADASYLTKNVSDTDLQNILKLANDHIHAISNSPDFNDERFLSQSGIAMKYKLIGLEVVASSIEAHMKKALQKRIELISSILSMVNGEEIWRDIDIVFTRNLPVGLEPNNSSELMAYKGLVSDATLLTQVPFVKDVDVELGLIQTQKDEEMELYMQRESVNNEEEDEDDK